jgi:hypothetical protein
MKDSQNPFYNELYSCLLEEYNVKYLINAYLKSLESRDLDDQESIYGSIFKRILFDFNRKPKNIHDMDQYFNYLNFLKNLFEN